LKPIVDGCPAIGLQSFGVRDIVTEAGAPAREVAAR
jgi:hypothetical protein